MRSRIGFSRRLFGAYAVVLGLGVVLVLHVYRAGERLGAGAADLAGRELAVLTAAGALQAEVRAQEALLHRYYVDRDRLAFEARHAAVQAAGRRALERLAAAGADDLAADYTHLEAAAARLEQALGARPPRDAAARAALAEAGAAAGRLTVQLAARVEAAAAALERGAQAQRQTAGTMQAALLALAGAILAVSLLVGWLIRSYLAAEEAGRRLAQFPEHDPVAVLRLGPDGRIDYANPAAVALARALGAETADPAVLLPEDAGERLALLRRTPPAAARWEYRAGGRVLECRVHWLAELDAFHAYIADVSERKRAEEQLVQQAYHDPLTGLPNRRLFEEQLEHRLYAERRGGMRAAFLLLGVDRFRVIIESFGPGAGDALLRALAARLRELLRAGSDDGEALLYRMDGDRFAVFVPGFTAAQAPMRLAERLLAGVRAPFYALGREYHLSLSIGISIYPLDGQDAQTLERNAETAMQRVKRQGGASFECYTREMNERAAEWLGLENELRHAEKLGELQLHYQPQLDCDRGRLVGAEALIRWQHPTRGLLLPGQFMALAEESGLVLQIGDWVLRTACAQAAAWRRTGLDGLTVAVNLSARQFAQPELPARIAELLRERDLPPACLELEITENVAMHDTARTVDTLEQLRAIGVRLAVDDFGTGFSSLSYLKRFPLDKLKVDQSFVRHLPHDDNDAAIARAVIALGNSLRLKVIAEGVETAEQLAWLRASGCHEYQGFLFSAALPPERFAERVRAPR